MDKFKNASIREKIPSVPIRKTDSGCLRQNHPFKINWAYAKFQEGYWKDEGANFEDITLGTRKNLEKTTSMRIIFRKHFEIAG